MADGTSGSTSSPSHTWKPLEALDRRVLGVLVEKAKTTPEAYPLSLNALRTGCNQKNNRFPLMDVEPEDVEEALDRLRELGAVAEVQGGGRVPRYRHYLYEWLGVEKAELAVMAELLLRGAQTEGELRGRAARMEPLPDLNALRPILQSLEQKGLVVSLSPAGRGHVITHNLYQEREMEKLRREFGVTATASPQPPAETPHHTPTPAPTDETASTAPATQPIAAPSRPAEPHYASRESVAELKEQLEALRSEVASLRKDLDDLWSNFR